MNNQNAKQKEYATLLIQVGLAVREGQEVVIHAPVAAAPFARLCMHAAYDVGAKDVTVVYSDDEVTKAHFLRAAEEVFDKTPLWRQQLMNGYAKEGAACLFIAASDPTNLSGVSPERLLRNARAKGRDLAEFYRLETSNFFPWCIASVPVASWAKKVFPDLPEEEAMNCLEDAIYRTVRIDGSGNAVARWRAHLAMLKSRTEKLNSFRFTSLHYENSLGTNLTVHLPEGHIWQSGEDVTPNGQRFVANMPTEEIFTAPLRDGTEGIAYAALPLVHNGNLIRNFSLTFHEGKITEVHAQEGEEVLKNAIAVDEGASYLGEVALVPYDSPISNQGILYYETLFDENAACHLAFGEAYPCLEGGNEMTEEELRAHGLNTSAQHVDFMVGTADLSITGRTADGKEIPVFRNGNFAF